MDSSVVIKVKYGETLRRFSACIVDSHFDLNMDRLREKIAGLFKFSPDTELTMTYIDEDDDIVTLADDEDLRDVVKQGLDPLRITVNLSTGQSDKSSTRTSGTSTPLRSPEVQQPLHNFNSEILNSIPEPLRRIFTNLAAETLSSSGITSATSLQHFLEMCLSQFSGQQSGSDSTAHGGGASGGTTNVTVSQDSGGPNINETGDVAVVPAAVAAAVHVSDGLSDDQSKKVYYTNSKPGASLKMAKVKSQSGISCSKGSARIIPGLEDLRAALESVTESTPVNTKLPGTSHTDIGKNKFIKLPVSGTPPVSKSVPAGKKEASEKSTTSDVPKPTIKPFPLFVSWSNPNSQPPPNSSSEDIRNTFGSTPGNSSASNAYPSLVSECPFTGMPLENSSAIPARTHPFVAQSRRSQRQGDGPVMIFHHGVRCDGCGVHPITGIRFKSKVKEDYDLCTLCFGQMGNEEDYIRMDRPMTYRPPFSFKGLHELPTRGHTAHPQVLRGCGMKPSRSKLDSLFIQDINVADGTLMGPLTPFTKIWRMRNNGSVVWPQGTQLVWIGGDKLTDAFSTELEIADAGGLPVGFDLEISVDFVAPKHPGKYISYWRMASPSGQKFGQRVWVLIQVDANELPAESLCDINLNLPPVSNRIFNYPIPDVNLPPVSNGISNQEILDMNLPPPVSNRIPYCEPMVENRISELGLIEFASSNRTRDLVEPIVDLPVEKGQEANFPINDSLLVGGIVSRPDPAAPSSSSVSYPIVDLSEVAPTPVLVSASSTVVQTSPVGMKNEVEETLLKDLEEMGFRQVDLNKEVLRLNEYDFEKSVDDLCGVWEWDPILEELNEMGFCDEERNRKLLKKNNGSIKRVVMDLLAGEKK